MTPAERRRRARRRQVLELRDKGWSLRAIGAHLGVDAATVMRDLRRSALQKPVSNATPDVAFVAPDLQQSDVDWDAEMIQLTEEAP
jgi:IS30 family transposase